MRTTPTTVANPVPATQNSVQVSSELSVESLSQIAMDDYHSKVSARKAAQANYAQLPKDPQIGDKKSRLGKVAASLKTRDPNKDSSVEEYLMAAIKARAANDRLEALRNERDAAEEALVENRAQIQSARKELGLWFLYFADTL